MRGRTVELHQVILAATVLSAGLAAGVFFTFTSLVIPGLLDMEPRAALRSFQAIDGRLQPAAPSLDWQPVFGAVIFGAGALTLVTSILGWSHFSTIGRILAVAAATTYNFGFWLPTVTTIVPFNNRVRDADIEALGTVDLTSLCRDFERSWRGWNLLRTVSSTVAFALLVVLGATG